MENIAKIEQPFGQSPPRVHCPVCGNKIIVEGDIVPCDHLLYFFITACGEFIYQRDDVKVHIENVYDEDGDIEDISGTILKKLKKPSALALEITYGGMACGPIWDTDYVGFDFEVIDPEPEE